MLMHHLASSVSTDSEPTQTPSRSMASVQISAREKRRRNSSVAERRHSMLLEEPAVWSRSMHCRNLGLRRPATPLNSDARRGGKLSLALVRERISFMEMPSTISETMFWMQMTGLLMRHHQYRGRLGVHQS